MRVLGVSPFHDSSVAVINDGELEFFFKEERYSGKKRDYMPFNSILLAYNKLKELNADIDYITLASPTENDSSLISIKECLTKFFNCPVIVYCGNHHLAHASLAFYNSGFSDSLVFVVDRNGSLIAPYMREAETVFKATYPCEFKTLHKNYWMISHGEFNDLENLKVIDVIKKDCDFSYNVDSSYSIVKVYESATTLIGQNPLENGKTMGLASYGSTENLQNLFYNNRPIDNLFIHGEFGHFETTKSVLKRKHLGKVESNITKENYKFYADYAQNVQQETQKVLLNLVKEWVDKTGITNVCLTGGYALNVVANNYLIKNLPNVSFYFEPLADDSGNSIGSAMHLYRDKTKDININSIKTTFVHGIKKDLPPCGKPCTVDEISDFLNDGKIVAVFNGLAESGPRALGNRSILFDPRNKDGKDIVNTVKNREWYRPFAGMILKEHFCDYFETHGLTSADFMTVSFDCKKPEEIPAVVHVDNSTRVQTIDEQIPHIHSLLTSFYNKTGCPVLLNTSFNLAGQPLVETVEQAIVTFINSKIDILWFSETNTMVKKENI